jgi:hypothetical protein
MYFTVSGAGEKPDPIGNSLAGTCIFLGKKSALTTKKVADAPFGQDVLRWVSDGNPLEGRGLIKPQIDVNIRAICPTVGNNYGVSRGVLHPGEGARFDRVEALNYANDIFYWGHVVEVRR